MNTTSSVSTSHPHSTRLLARLTYLLLGLTSAGICAYAVALGLDLEVVLAVCIFGASFWILRVDETR
ncbi:MAG: hypothetical protein AAGF11_20145 [Myxococcota bacterium]